MARFSTLGNPHTVDELQALVVAHNPAVFVDTADVRKQDAQLKSAQREAARMRYGTENGLMPTTAKSLLHV